MREKQLNLWEFQQVTTRFAPSADVGLGCTELTFGCPHQRLPYFPGDTDSSDPFIMTNSTENILIDTGIYNIALQTSGLTIGPMPVQSFLDEFLPNLNARRPATRNRKGICSRLPVKKAPGALVSQYSSFLSCPSNTRLD